MILSKYNQAKTITFNLVKPDGVDYEIAATFAPGDIIIMKDEGAEASATNLPVDEGIGYSLLLTATEMSASRIVIYIIDQSGTKVWLDSSIGVETYGNASGEHAFDLNAPSVDVGSIDNNISSAQKLAASASTITTGTATGTPTTTEMEASGLTETTNGHYNGRTLIWTSGALKDQGANITGYNGTTKTFTFTARTEAAVAADTFVIV